MMEGHSRRQMLLASVAASVLPGCVMRPASTPAPLGIGDITVRKELQADFTGTLAKLKVMGYTHFGSRMSAYSPAEPPEPLPADKAQMLRDAGLLPGPARLGFGSPLERDIEAALAFGASTLVLSAGHIFFDVRGGMKPRTPTRAELDSFIVELGTMGAKINTAGLKFAYHNHWFDSTPIEGVRPLDLMIERSNPAHVFFEIDLAWAHIAGEDVLGLIRRLGPRLVSMHVKDVDRSLSEDFQKQMVPAGDGEMNYATLAPAIRALTNALPVVEVDAPADGLVAAARACQFIRKSWQA